MGWYLYHTTAHPDTHRISLTYTLMASMWVVALHSPFLTRTCPYPVTLLPIGSDYFRVKPFPV